MKSNLLEVAINYVNLDESFDFYAITKSEGYYDTRVLDEISVKAVAVQYKFGATALLMSRKGSISYDQLSNDIISKHEGIQIKQINILDKSEREKYFYYQDRLLVQLLCNSLANTSIEKYEYHNITGALYYPVPLSFNPEDKFVRFAKISFEPGMLLAVENVTFRECDRKYADIIRDDLGRYRAALTDDKNCICYQKRSFTHKKNTLQSYSFGSISLFTNSKLGIMNRLISDVNSRLSKFLSIKQVDDQDMINYKNCMIRYSNITESQIGELINPLRIAFVDEIGTDKSQEMIDCYTRNIEECYGCSVVRTDEWFPSKDYLYIRIIHDEEYYETNKIPDPHKDNLSDYIVQHVAIESFMSKVVNKNSYKDEELVDDSNTSEKETTQKKSKESKDLVLKKILLELILKKDIRDLKATLFNWNDYETDELHVVTRKSIKSSKDVDNSHTNTVGKLVKRYFTYYHLRIDKDGNLHYDTFTDKDVSALDRDSVEYKIIYAYDDVHSRENGSNLEIDGLIFEDVNSIKAIICTHQIILPDILESGKAIRASNPKEKLNVLLIREQAREFLKDKESSEISQTILMNLDAIEGDYVARKEISKRINVKSDIGCELNDFIFQNIGILINSLIRRKESPVSLSDLSGIKFKVDKEDFNSGSAIRYAVSDSKSAKISNERFDHVRKIVYAHKPSGEIEDDELDFDKYLPMLTVGFVRENQYTVIPFPFKYLRGFIDMED